MRKAQLIVRMMSARDEWEHLINQVGLRVGMRGVSGHWSVKNIVAHVMTHEQHLADRLTEIVHGESYRPSQTYEALDAFLAKYGFPDFDSPLISVDAADEWVYEKYKNASMNELIADELHAFSTLLTAMRNLSEDQLIDLDLFQKIRHATVDHYRQHAADIRKHFKQPLRQA
jgi:hypothetical protein